MPIRQLDFMYSQDVTLSDASSVNPKHFGGKPLHRHPKRNYARLQLWVIMKHCQVPVYFKVISNFLFNISLWFFPLYIFAQKRYFMLFLKSTSANSNETNETNSNSSPMSLHCAKFTFNNSTRH